MGRLRDYARCMTSCEIAHLCCDGGCCGDAAAASGASAQRALQQQLELLASISQHARAEMQNARRQLDEGAADAANRAALQAALVARDVQIVAGQKLEDLAKRGDELRAEATALRTQAAESASAGQAAATAVQAAPGVWHFAEAEKAVRAAMLAEGLIAHSQNNSVDSRRLAREADYVAMEAVDLSTEAAVHASNASAMALQAVEQAAQNSMKLKAITQMIQEFESTR